MFNKSMHLISVLSFFVWNLAVAAPEGGNVVAGSAAISQSGSTTTITQASQSAVINWTGFNTTASESVRFNQPNASAIALNRINSGLPTTFNGSLSANGHVWIINPNGIVFGSTSTVNVAGLLATTHAISDGNFMAGNYKFDLVPGSESSKIINNGSISTIVDNGMVALVAPGVENNGIIQAHLGKVVLASGAAFVLDLYGDSLINFGSSPKVDSGYVSNSGIIKATGGKVLMTANSAGKLLNNVISMSGTIEATTATTGQHGTVILNAGPQGKLKVSGKVNVSDGGYVETSGAVVDTSSATLMIGSGGTWLIDPPGDITINPADEAAIEAQLNSGVSVEYSAPAGSIYLETIISALSMPNIFFLSFTLTAGVDVHIDSPITLSGLGSFVANAGGTIFLNTPSINVPFGQTYNAPAIVMQQSLTLSGGPSTNDIFVGTLDGDGLGPWDLLVTSSDSVIFNGDVGVSNPLNSIDITTAGGTIEFNSPVAQTIQTFNSQRYRTLTYLVAPSVTFHTLNQTPAVIVEFDNFVNGIPGGTPSDLTIDGNLLIGNPNGTIGFSTLAYSLIGNVLVTGSATGNIISNVTAGSNGNQTYMGPFTLTRNDILVSSGTITFNDTVNSDAFGPWNLDITAPLTVFNKPVGNTGALNNLTITGATNINTNVNAVSNSIKTERNQVYGGPVTLNINTVLTSNIQNITFHGTVNGPGGLIANVTNGTMFANGHMGSGTPLAYLTVSGIAQGVNIISVGDINMGPFNVVTNDFVQSLTGNVSFLGGPVTLFADLTVSAANKIFFGFGTNGVNGPAFNLSASTFNPANGPTGAGISGTVNVAQFSMGGLGGGDISPITLDSIVDPLNLNGGALNFAFVNTTILPGAIGFYCVNGACAFIAPPVSPINPASLNASPGDISSTQLFTVPNGETTCDENGCDNVLIKIYDNSMSFMNCHAVYQERILGKRVQAHEPNWMCVKKSAMKGVRYV